MALSKNKIKYVQSLKNKKERVEHGVFVAEGIKLVSELMTTCRCQWVAALPSVFDELPKNAAEEYIVADASELQKATLLKTAPQAIGVFYQPNYTLDMERIQTELILVLDGVQDPGNLGTIVRIADWFGIKHIICSHDTADSYNPKVVQATMGAIARVKIIYTDIIDFLSRCNEIPVFGTFLDGKNIYETQLPSHGCIVMGNEGNGIRAEVEKRISHRLFIPNFPIGSKTSESLNVAVATAITCSEFRRRV